MEFDGYIFAENIDMDGFDKETINRTFQLCDGKHDSNYPTARSRNIIRKSLPKSSRDTYEVPTVSTTSFPSLDEYDYQDIDEMNEIELEKWGGSLSTTWNYDCGFGASKLGSEIRKWDAEVLRVSQLYAEYIQADVIEATNLFAKNINAVTLKVNEIGSKTEKVNNLFVKNGYFNNLSTDFANIKSLFVTEAKVLKLKADSLQVTDELRANIFNVQDVNSFTIKASSLRANTVYLSPYTNVYNYYINQDRIALGDNNVGQDATFTVAVYTGSKEPEPKSLRFKGGILVGGTVFE